MTLSSKQRAQLRGIAMTEDTIIQIGKAGITENTVTEVNNALAARELMIFKQYSHYKLTGRRRRG